MTPSSKIGSGKTLLRLLFTVLILALDAYCHPLQDSHPESSAGEVCKKTKLNCYGPDCFEDVTCEHGYCASNGFCHCLSCYSGPSCSDYNNKYRPKFSSPEQTVEINADHIGAVYKASAKDDDLQLTCEHGSAISTECPCAAILYSLSISDPLVQNLFYIHEHSGELFIKEEAKVPGQQYKLDIVASGTDNGQRNKEAQRDKQVLTVIVKSKKDHVAEMLLKQADAFPEAVPLANNKVTDFEEDNEDEDEDEYDFTQEYDEEEPVSGAPPAAPLIEPETHSRVKRLTPGQENQYGDSKFELTELNTPPTEMRPGSTVNYKLEIILPRLTTAMDLTVEILGQDPVTGVTPFALCVTDVTFGDQILDENDDPLSLDKATVTKNPNGDLTDIHDHIVYDFGKVKNSDTYTQDTTDTADSTITIYFSAILVKNDNYDNESAIITSGAEYNSDMFVWVSQAEYNYSMTVVSGDYSYIPTLTGPDTAPQWSGVSFTVDAFVVYAKDTIYFTVFTPETNLPDWVTISSIYVVSTGENWVCCDESLRSIEYYPSVTGKTSHKATLVIPFMLKNLDYDNLAAASSSPKFKITIGFNVFVRDAPVDTSMEIVVGVIIGTESIWTATVPLSVAAEAPVAIGTVTWEDPIAALTSTAVPEGGTATWGAKATIEDGKGADISCSIDKAGDQSVCGIMYGSIGGKIAYVPDLTSVVTYDAGSASFSLTINSTGTGSGTNTIVFEISICYPTTARATMNLVCGTKTFPMDSTSGNQGSEDLTGVLSNLVTEDTWYDQSQAGLLITLTFPKGGIAYKKMTLEAAGDFEVSGWGVRVCGARIQSVGRAVPALAGQVPVFSNNIEMLKATNNSVFDDGMSVEMGPVSGTDRLSTTLHASEYEAKIKVFFEIPAGQSIVAGNFNASAGVNMDENVIWTGWKTFDISTATPIYDATVAPIWKIYNMNTAIDPGVPAIVRVVLQMHPGSIGVIKMTFSVDDTSQISICKVLLLGVGENFPCVDPEPYGKEEEEYQSTTLVHDKEDWGKEAVLDLGTLQNLGSGEIDPDGFPNKDSILVGVVLSGVAESGSGTFTALLDTSGTENSQTLAFTTTSNAPNTGTVAGSVEVSGQDGTDVAYKGVMKMIEVKLTLPNGYAQKVTITVKNSDLASVKVCTAGLLKVGDNIPCLVPQNVQSSQTVATETNEEFEVQLGNVCQHPMIDNVTENEVVVGVGAMFLPKATATSASFSVVVVEDTTDAATLTYDFTLGNADYVPGDTNSDGMSLDAVENTTTPVTPGQIVNTRIIVTFPPFQTVPLEIGVMSPSDGGRAYATLHDIKFAELGVYGKNIGCLLEDCSQYDPLVFQNNTDGQNMIHSSQTDTISVEMGYITNAGFSHLFNNKSIENDQFMLDIETMIADHPNASGGDVIEITIAVKLGDVIMVVDKAYSMDRSGTPNLSIISKIFLTDNSTTLYQRAEDVGLTLQVYHEYNVSTQEANDFKLRVFLPKFMHHESDDEWNANITGNKTENHYIEYDMGYLFFTDILEVNFTVTADPRNEIPTGLGNLNALTMLRLLCTTVDNTNPRYCGTTAHVSYEVSSPDCFDDLGVDSMSDCQISASTAIDGDSDATKAKRSSTGAWKPAVRTGDGWEPAITVDFLRRARVTKVTFTTESGCRRVTSFKIQYAHSPTKFTDACPNDIQVPDNDVVILPSECRFEARLARLIITSGDGDASGQSFGVKLDLFGCYMEQDETATCSPSLTTVLSSEVTKWRHIAFDSANSIIYFCDYAPKKKRLVCFSSANDGATWNALPSYIGQLLGFDSTTAKMYATDRKEVSTVSSEDGITWSIVSTTEAAAINPTAPTPMPGKTSPSLSTVSLGPWQADFTGLKSGGVYKAKWSTCCG